MTLPPAEGQNQVQLKYVKCILCGKDNAQPYVHIQASDFLPKQPGARVENENGVATLVKCQDCGLVYVNPRWVFPEGLMPYNEEAEQQYFDATYAERRCAYQELLGQLPRLLNGPARRILDVGCGDGVLLELCKEAGLDCEGGEVSQPLVENLRRRFGEAAIHGSSLVHIPPETFDVVFLINVIEHVEDPLELLEQVYQVLRPGGIVLIHAPNFGGLPARLRGPHWHQIAPLVHLYYFTPATLRKVIAKSGLIDGEKFYLASSLWYKRAIQRVVYALGIQIDNGLGIVARRPAG